MTAYKIFSLLFFGLVIACKPNTNDKKIAEKEIGTTAAIEVQGHRGDRGNYPENSIPAFISAVKKGVDVLELDVVISKDRQVVVSHEPYMSTTYMLKPNGEKIAPQKAKSYQFYKMTYDSIRTFDGGSKINPHFPDQKKMKTHKPLLSEVMDTVSTFIAKTGLRPVRYNIEIKSKPEEYGIFQPFPEEFVNLVVQLIDQKKMRDQVIIQSFDINVLQVLHQLFPEIELAYLVSNGTLKSNLSLLGFKPDIYSPNFKLVTDKEFVDSIHRLEMKLIPWTINKSSNIQEMIRMGVDGVISDYPERVLALICVH